VHNYRVFLSNYRILIFPRSCCHPIDTEFHFVNVRDKETRERGEMREMREIRETRERGEIGDKGEIREIRETRGQGQLVWGIRKNY
jgi:hypothetical protein